MKEFMTNTEYADYIGVSSAWIGQLVKDGIIKQTSLKFFPPKKRPKIIVEKADKDLEDSKDASRDAQRRANAERRDDRQPQMDFVNGVQPKNETMAGLSSEELEARAKEQKEEFEKIKQLQREAENSKIENTPKADDSQAEWNKFWIMERGLKTALERQKLEGSLILVDDAKGLIERFMNPVVQKMDNLAYDFKNNFPTVDDATIDYLVDYINIIKMDAQKHVF